MNNHSVSEKALNKVVVMTALEDMMPLCPMFLDMIKLLLVVADPSIIKIATSFSFRYPMFMANGRNNIQNRNNLLNITATIGSSFSFSSPNSKAAPKHIKAKGEARFPKYVMDFTKITG